MFIKKRGPLSRQIRSKIKPIVHCSQEFTGDSLELQRRVRVSIRYPDKCLFLCFSERNFKEAKRLKEERETLTQEGVESQGKLESLLKEIAEDKKLLEEAEQESKDLDAEISEKDREAGKACDHLFYSLIIS